MNKDEKHLLLSVPIMLLEALPLLLIYYLQKAFNVAPGVSVVYLLVIWLVVVNLGLFVLFIFIRKKNESSDGKA